MHLAALADSKTKKPRLMFIGYGETDEWAHQRRYDLYLRSAHQVDADVAELWNTMQGMTEYRGTTTFIITCDHGRGSGNDWADHGREVADAENIWIAIIGPDTPNGGMVTEGPVTQSQIAATIATLLGQDFRVGAPNAAPPIAQAFTNR
jgi:phosphopentomutase